MICMGVDRTAQFLGFRSTCIGYGTGGSIDTPPVPVECVPPLHPYLAALSWKKRVQKANSLSCRFPRPAGSKRHLFVE